MSTETNSRWCAESGRNFSVLMIGHRSAALLRESLCSLEAFCRGDQWELILVLNGASPEVADFARRWKDLARAPVLLVTIPEMRPGAARSEGIPFCRGEVVFFLDDDILLSGDVITEAERIFRDPAVTAAGGANLTPPGSGLLARASGAVMESRIGAGRMSRRYRPSTRIKDADEHSLILCNLAVRREALVRAGNFPHSRMVSNEENLLLQRMTRAGGRMVSSPGLAVFHKRRGTWRGIARQAAKYGEGRAQNLILLPQTAHPRYLLPSGVFFLLAFSPWLGVGGRLALVGYASVAVAAAAAAAVKKRDGALLFLFPPVCLLVHLSYGWAFLTGMVRWLCRRERLLGVEAVD